MQYLQQKLAFITSTLLSSILYFIFKTSKELITALIAFDVMIYLMEYCLPYLEEGPLEDIRTMSMGMISLYRLHPWTIRLFLLAFGSAFRWNNPQIVVIVKHVERAEPCEHIDPSSEVLLLKSCLKFEERSKDLLRSQIKQSEDIGSIQESINLTHKCMGTIQRALLNECHDNCKHLQAVLNICC